MSEDAADHPPSLVQADPWTALRALTPARIALGRAGAALPTAEVLDFGLAHAQARDAVHTPLDTARLVEELATAGWPALTLASRATDRQTYLLRPDLGRRVAHADLPRLTTAQPYTLAFVLADGLSARAVQAHAVPLLDALRDLLDPAWRIAPVCVVTQGRVAIGDEIGAALRAQLVAVLIGERPGLSSPDSLGAYLTWAPGPATSDADRNCVSNIRPQGLAPEAAARKIAWLLDQMRRQKQSGVALKDLTGQTPALG